MATPKNRLESTLIFFWCAPAEARVQWRAHRTPVSLVAGPEAPGAVAALGEASLQGRGGPPPAVAFFSKANSSNTPDTDGLGPCRYEEGSGAGGGRSKTIVSAVSSTPGGEAWSGGMRNHGLRLLSGVSSEPPGRSSELCKSILGGHREVSLEAGPELTESVSVAISAQAI